MSSLYQEQGWRELLVEADHEIHESRMWRWPRVDDQSEESTS